MSLDVHFSTVSTLHLCCIAVDRYFAIVRPLKYTTYMTVKVAACMIGVAWTAPIVISFLPIFLGWYTTEQHQKWREEHPDECKLRVKKTYMFCFVCMDAFPKEGSGYPIRDFASRPGNRTNVPTSLGQVYPNTAAAEI